MRATEEFLSDGREVLLVALAVVARIDALRVGMPEIDAGALARLAGGAVDHTQIDPQRHAESAGILAEVRRVVDEVLTAHQRRIFVAIVVDGIPLDALAAATGLRRNAIYKVIFDARRKIRRALVANGYLEETGGEQR